MLILDLSPGERVQIGSDVTVTMEKKTGQVARLAFDADRSIPIRRVTTDPEPPRKRMTFGLSGSGVK